MKYTTVPTTLASLSWLAKPLKTWDIGIAARPCHLKQGKMSVDSSCVREGGCKGGCAAGTGNSGDHPELSRLTYDNPTAKQVPLPPGHANDRSPRSFRS
jgi:hypothetical protein